MPYEKVSSSPRSMWPRANIAICGTMLPAVRTSTGSRLPPPQRWLKKRATLPTWVASIEKTIDVWVDGRT